MTPSIAGAATRATKPTTGTPTSRGNRREASGDDPHERRPHEPRSFPRIDLPGRRRVLRAKAETDWYIVDTVLTRKAAVSGEVHRYRLPRSDLDVTLDGVALRPGFALVGWLDFEPMGDKAMMMGDLVLTEKEINPVMSKLLAEALQVTALHNHLLRASPPTFYMHVEGTGDPAQLARLARAALEESRTALNPRLKRRRQAQVSISTQRRSTRRSATRARRTAASTSSAYRAPAASRWMG